MHQDLPFEKLVELLNLEKDPSRHPIFQIMFSVQSFGSMQTSDTAILRPLDVSSAYQVSKFDLSLFIDDAKDGISVSFNYATRLFERATIARLARHYKNILSCIAAGEDKLISNVPLLSPAEYDQIIHDWNETYSPYPQDKTIVDLFEERAARYPITSPLFLKEKC